MAQEAQPLSDDERAELEALRAEKAAREQREQAARERAELEALRAEQARETPGQKQAAAAPAPAPAQAARKADAAEVQRIKEARARGAQLMEPDDDLRMPLGQKVVLAVLAVLVAIVIGMNLLVG